MIVRPKFWFWFSLATMVACVLIIVIIRPVWGIDFVGGSLLEVRASEENLPAIQSLLAQNFGIAATIQNTPEGSLVIRTPQLNTEQHTDILGAFTDKKLMEEELRFESIGPTIGKSLRNRALWALGVALVLMVVYLAYSFRGAKGLTSPWKFGIAATYALFHDLLVVTAAFVILGKLWGIPLDVLFVTALLAIFGYSVNDTIVLFNRMKSNWMAKRSGDLLTNIDHAVKDTLIRSLNTSLPILLTLITMLVFGGTTLRWFLIALTIGTVSGAYSTIFVAAPCLYYLTKKR